MTVTEKWPEVSDDPAIQAFYEARREDGVSHTLAEMFAFQQAPLPKDDTSWFKLMRPKEQLADAPPIVQETYTKEALAHGDNISGAVYVPQLARHPGDREAWVHGLGDIKKRVEERGWAMQGAAGEVKPNNDVEPPPDVDVADDIVEQKVLDMMAENPDLVPTAEVFHEAKEAIKPHWS